MKLDLHKNITASVTLDNNKMMDHETSMVYGKIEDDDIFLFVKDPINGRTMKIHIRKYAEEVREEKDI
tara:strand:+ start:980 stop:1183 length:204 start_codon:yes stop_codon:yes gene_type:complete